LFINDISRETHTKWYYITVRFSSHMAKLSTPSLWAGISLPTGGCTHPALTPPKIGKNLFFWRKIMTFHTKYPKHFRASLRNWKK
jgi:hypothetical protein